MTPAVFQALQAARATLTPVVLVRHLPSGGELLLDEARALAGDLAAKDDLLTAARAALAEDRSRLREDGAHFLQVFSPPPRLLVVGAVHIAQALVPMAQLLGYGVVVIDPRHAWASAARFPGITLTHDWPDEALAALRPDRRSAVVTLTHDPKLDDPALIRALRSPAFYLGALGSRRTHEKRRQRLLEAGLTDGDIARIDAPVGLAIGAKSPAEIAVSILARITQVRRSAA